MKLTPPQAAVSTGIAILVMAVLAFVGVSALNELTTAEASQASALLLQGLVAWELILLADIIAALGLVVVLRHTGTVGAVVTGLLRLAYAVFLGVAVYQLGSSTGHTTVAEIHSSVAGFHHWWNLGLIVFGLHLLALGALVVRSQLLPSWLGVVILAAGLGYLFLNGGQLVLPHLVAAYRVAELVFIPPMIVGEVGLAVWLIWRRQRLA